MYAEIENLDSGKTTTINNPSKLKSKNYNIISIDFYDDLEINEFEETAHFKYLDNNKVLIAILKEKPSYIKNIYNQTEEMQMLATNYKDGGYAGNVGGFGNLKYCKKPSKRVIDNAIKNSELDAYMIEELYEMGLSLSTDLKIKLLKDSNGYTLVYFKKEDITREDEELALELRNDYDLFKSYSFKHLSKETMLGYLKDFDYKNKLDTFQLKSIEYMNEKELQDKFDSYMKQLLFS